VLVWSFGFRPVSAATVACPYDLPELPMTSELTIAESTINRAFPCWQALFYHLEVEAGVPGQIRPAIVLPTCP
jgi:hypothetical protein